MASESRHISERIDCPADEVYGVGTPGPATLGLDEPEMKEVASILGEVLRQPGDEGVKDKARARVRDLVARFPAYA